MIDSMKYLKSRLTVWRKQIHFFIHWTFSPKVKRAHHVLLESEVGRVVKVSRSSTGYEINGTCCVNLGTRTREKHSVVQQKGVCNVDGFLMRIETRWIHSNLYREQVPQDCGQWRFSGQGDNLKPWNPMVKFLLGFCINQYNVDWSHLSKKIMQHTFAYFFRIFFGIVQIRSSTLFLVFLWNIRFPTIFSPWGSTLNHFDF